MTRSWLLSYTTFAECPWEGQEEGRQLGWMSWYSGVSVLCQWSRREAWECRSWLVQVCQGPAGITPSGASEVRVLARSYRHLSLKSITCDMNVCWEPRCAHVRRSTFSWNSLLPSGFNLPAVHTQLPRDFELDAVHWIHFPLRALGIGILYSAIIPCFLNLYQYISAQDAPQSSSTPNLDLLPAKALGRMSW